MTAPEVRRVRLDRLNLQYRELGDGPPVLLVHGWPTSSFLWRNVMPAIARHRRVIAVDLPGFGGSDKPLDASYGFEFFTGVLDAFLAAIGVDGKLAIVVHDLGGPVGLYWAAQNAERIERVAILNTVVYPEVSLAATAFFAACRTPGIRWAMTSQLGLAANLRLGVGDARRLPPDATEGVCAPFRDPDARRALALAGQGLSPPQLAAGAEWLQRTKIPVRVIVGAKDWLLPDIATTVARLRRDVPHAEVTVLDDCGHFLQEERPEEIGELLATFLGPNVS